ncbi:MAG: hypothetical protein P8Y71_07925 [Pseudolabrys sp.]|jgi:hypothetical protein
MRHDTQRFALAAATALAVAVLAAPAAQAFTFERNAPGDNGAALNYTDPMENLAPKSDDSRSFDENGTTRTLHDGNFSVQFHSSSGTSSFNQRYNPNNLFDPFAREGR